MPPPRGARTGGAGGRQKHFRRQDHGVLINISSVVGEVAQPFTAAYSLSKAGINALSVSIRSELSTTVEN